MDGVLQNVERNTGQLEVQLVTGYTNLRAAKLEVHVTVEVLRTDDVEQRLIASGLTVTLVSELCYKAYRDTGNRALQRHTGCQQGKRAGANGSHGSRTVGLHNLGRYADSVGEISLVRNYGSNGTLCKSTVTDFTTVLTTETAGLTHSERGEVVVQNEALLVYGTRVVIQVLLLLHGGKSSQAHGHGLTTREQSRTVYHGGQHVHLSRERTQLLDGAAVCTLTLLHDGDTESLLLNVLKYLLYVKVCSLGVCLLNLSLNLITESTYLLLALNLVGSINSILNAVTGYLITNLKQLRLSKGQLILTSGLAAKAAQLLLSSTNLSYVLLSKTESSNEVLLRKLISRTLNHDNLILRTGVYQVKVRLRALAVGGVDNELTVNATYAYCTYRLSKGKVRNHTCGRCTVDAEDIRLILAISRHQQRNHLRVIEVTLGEHRTKRAVRHTARQNLLLRGAPLTLEVTAREHTGCGSLLFVLNGKREECLSLFNLGGTHNGNENHGITTTNSYCAICQAGNLTGFNCDGIGAYGARYGMYTHFSFFYLLVPVPCFTAEDRNRPLSPLAMAGFLSYPALFQRISATPIHAFAFILHSLRR